MTCGGPTARLAVGRQRYARGGRKMSAPKRGCGASAEGGSGSLARAGRARPKATWDGIEAAPAQPEAMPPGPSGQCEEPASAGRWSAPGCVPWASWSAAAARATVAAAAALTDGAQGAVWTHCQEAWASATSARTLQNVRARRFIDLARRVRYAARTTCRAALSTQGTMPRSCAARWRGCPDLASGDPPTRARRRPATQQQVPRAPNAPDTALRAETDRAGRHDAGPAACCATTVLRSRARPVDPASPFS